MSIFDEPRKPRSSSVLDRLTGEQKERLQVWLGEENRSYTEVKELVAAEFGVVTSRSALSRYFRRCAAARTAENTELGVLGLGFGVGIDGAEELAAWRELPVETSRVIEDAAMARARQLAFSALTKREPEVRLAERMVRLVCTIERMRLARERAELQGRRVALMTIANCRMPNGGGQSMEAARETERRLGRKIAECQMPNDGGQAAEAEERGRGRGMENADWQMANEDGRPTEAEGEIEVRFGGGGAGVGTGISHLIAGRAA